MELYDRGGDDDKMITDDCATTISIMTRNRIHTRNTGLGTRMTRKNLSTCYTLIQEQHRQYQSTYTQLMDDNRGYIKNERNEMIERLLGIITNNHCDDFGGIMIDATVSGVPLKLHSTRIINNITSICRGHRIYRIHPIRSSLGVNMKMDNIRNYVYVWEVICVFNVDNNLITASHEAIMVIRGNGEIINLITYDHLKIPRIVTRMSSEHRLLSYKGHELPDFMVIGDINHECSHICGVGECKAYKTRIMYDCILNVYIRDINDMLTRGINERNALYFSSFELGIILTKKGYNNGPCFFTHVMLISDHTFGSGQEEKCMSKEDVTSECKAKYVRLLGTIVGKADKNQTYFCDPSLSTYCFISIDTDDYKNIFPLQSDLSAIIVGNNGIVTSGDFKELLLVADNSRVSSYFLNDNSPKRRCIVTEYDSERMID